MCDCHVYTDSTVITILIPVKKGRTKIKKQRLERCIYTYSLIFTRLCSLYIYNFVTLNIVTFFGMSDTNMTVLSEHGVKIRWKTVSLRSVSIRGVVWIYPRVFPRMSVRQVETTLVCDDTSESLFVPSVTVTECYPRTQTSSLKLFFLTNHKSTGKSCMSWLNVSLLSNRSSRNRIIIFIILKTNILTCDWMNKSFLRTLDTTDGRRRRMSVQSFYSKFLKCTKKRFLVLLPSLSW